MIPFLDSIFFDFLEGNMKRLKLFIVSFLLVPNYFHLGAVEDVMLVAGQEEASRVVDFLTPSSDRFEIGKTVGNAYHQVRKITVTKFARAVLNLIDFSMSMKALNGDVDSQRWMCDATSAALRKELAAANFVDLAGAKERWQDQETCEGIRRDVNEMLIDLESLITVHNIIGAIKEFEENGKKVVVDEEHLSRIKNLFTRFKDCAQQHSFEVSEFFEKKVFNNLSFFNVELALKYMAFECCEIIDMQEQACDIDHGLFEWIKKEEEALAVLKERVEASDVFNEIADLYISHGLTEEMLDDDVHIEFGETVWDTTFWDGNVELQLLLVEFFLTMLEKDMFKNMFAEEQKFYREIQKLGILHNF